MELYFYLSMIMAWSAVLYLVGVRHGIRIQEDEEELERSKPTPRCLTTIRSAKRKHPKPIPYYPGRTSWQIGWWGIWQGVRSPMFLALLAVGAVRVGYLHLTAPEAVPETNTYTSYHVDGMATQEFYTTNPLVAQVDPYSGTVTARAVGTAEICSRAANICSRIKVTE